MIRFSIDFNLMVYAYVSLRKSQPPYYHGIRRNIKKIYICNSCPRLYRFLNFFLLLKLKKSEKKSVRNNFLTFFIDSFPLCLECVATCMQSVLCIHIENGNLWNAILASPKFICGLHLISYG